jgi:thiol-disulfide isomerase/thioredoxin
MKKIILVAAAALIVACGTQEKAVTATATETASIQEEVMENAKQESIYGQVLNGNLHGLQNKASFMQAPYSNWFVSGYDSYTPNAEVAAQLKKAMKGVTVKAFMGTWCGDSQRETPHFYKLMEIADVKEKSITMVSVDRSKSQPVNLVAGNDISRVPTFIFYKDGKELGRYVEYARESMESDFLKIVTGQDYKHSYQN